jgi:hypothetical protein
MNSHAQADASLDGLIMLGIGYVDDAVTNRVVGYARPTLLLRAVRNRPFQKQDTVTMLIAGPRRLVSTCDRCILPSTRN